VIRIEKFDQLETLRVGGSGAVVFKKREDFTVVDPV
jgi:hypothetical protein